MKQKILKLIKRLSRFTIDDIAIMSECDENSLVPVMDNFEDDGIIKKWDILFLINHKFYS